ncbi:BESS domain-containing protein [Aphis craccivora]|uniref:BESS domain-containing protein n=1 Tax=Aphis craccivora TaxID=307492 RepID=A0A6G0VWQ9_APHCR|nr:BESS domain-containing protein [Aphis craccivora]
MHFCLPFIKTSAPPSAGNLPPVPLNSPGEVVDDTEIFEDSASQMDLSQTFVPTQTSFPDSPVHSPFQLSNSTENSTPFKQTIDQPEKIEFEKKTSAAAADHSVAEYFNAKRARLQINEAENSSQKIDRQQGIKMFLLSLIPELEDLNDSQIKLFKRRVFNIIDDISTPLQYQPQVSTFQTMIPSASNSSQMSHVSQTTDFCHDFSQNLHNSDI